MVTGRIHITGASGSGTTTLGAALAETFGCPHHDTDDFYWLPTDPPYREERDPVERLRLIDQALRDAPAWVLSGSIGGWGEPLTALFDAVVFLTVPTAARIERLRARCAISAGTRWRPAARCTTSTRPSSNGPPTTTTARARAAAVRSTRPGARNCNAR